MEPYLSAVISAEHQQELRRRALRRNAAAEPPPAEVTIRLSTAPDSRALAALAELDEAPLPSGPALVAEVAGAPRAVLPLDGGRPFADPFSASGELVALLRVRAAQLRGPAPGRLRRLVGHAFDW